MEAIFGEPVTASATGRPQRVSEVPADMVIIGQDDIRRSGATNIPDVLRFVTGIDVRRYGSVDADVAIGGYNQPFNPRLLVMVNGRTVYGDSYGYVAWQLIPVQLEEIRQIEVVRGPNSALFGFNAASGVINIITYDPLFDHVNAATLRMGSGNQMQGSAVATVPVGENAGIRMSIGGMRRDEFSADGLPPWMMAVNRPPRLGAFSADGKARVVDGVEVSLSASMATAQDGESIIGGLPAFQTYHTNAIKAGITANTPLGTINVALWRNWFGTATVTPIVSSIALPVTNTVHVLQVSDTLRLNVSHVIRLGFEFRENQAYSAPVFGGTIGYTNVALSGMWDWQIAPSLSLTNSVRLDYLALGYSGTLIPGNTYTVGDYNRTKLWEPSFNSGLVYKATKQDTIRLTAARGLQAPSLIDYAIQYPANPPVGRPATLGSPTLRPTAVWNLELGWDHEIASLGSMVRGSVFVQRNDNLLAIGTEVLPRVLPTGLPASVSGNIGHSDAAGAQIEIKGQSSAGFRWNASYSLMGIADHTTVNKVYLTSPQNHQNGTPTNVIVLGGGYTHDKLEMDLSARWQSRYTDYRFGATGLTPIVIGDYVTFMGRIAYNLNDNLTVALSGQQFNVPRLLQSAGPPVERSVVASVTAHF